MNALNIAKLVKTFVKIGTKEVLDCFNKNNLLNILVIFMPIFICIFSMRSTVFSKLESLL